jgi:hypothetical protein
MRNEYDFSRGKKNPYKAIAKEHSEEDTIGTVAYHGSFEEKHARLKEDEHADLCKKEDERSSSIR